MSVLRQIFREREADLERAKSAVPLSELQARIRDQATPRGFLRALRESGQPLGLIAEIKPASPSQGAINLELDAGRLAQTYEAAGAHCLSVLTEPRHFGGSPENLKMARANSRLPALRKDFLNDPYQIYESRSWGADAVLLIVAALSGEQVRELRELAEELGMDVLVEVHSEAELEVAIQAGARLVGVNSRDLNTLQTDLTTAERLLPLVNDSALAVAESALSSWDDVERVRRAGAQAVLIGTAFCASPDVFGKVREVMGW